MTRKTNKKTTLGRKLVKGMTEVRDYKLGHKPMPHGERVGIVRVGDDSSENAGDKISKGLREALAFAKGDTRGARVTKIRVGDDGKATVVERIRYPSK